MKHILVNLKRFDIPPEFGGVNRIAPSAQWAQEIIAGVARAPVAHPGHEFLFFLPELHLLGALAARPGTQPIIGCQSVIAVDTAVGGGFGAFTTARTANAMAAAGVEAALVGHSEERAMLRSLLSRATDGRVEALVHSEINARAQAAQRAGLRVVLCLGEAADERDHWREVLAEQLDACLPGLARDALILAYEPIWAIGPGKTPPDRDQIQQVAAHVKALAPEVPLVYGGGLKVDNATQIASVPELDGGLIALTRFTGEIGFSPKEFLQIVAAYFADEEITHEA